MRNQSPKFKHISLQDYQAVHEAMIEFTDKRNPDTRDEVWFVEHNPVFTLGRNGNKSNLLKKSDIPVIESDRGGDITYHGPGQLVVYCLLDIARLNIGVKSLVKGLEEIVIRYLARHSVDAHRLEKAPGVYVDGAKIASLGLRVRNGCTFHGLAINVDMDTQPFSYINPCGLENMQVVQMRELNVDTSVNQLAADVSELIQEEFYTSS